MNRRIFIIFSVILLGVSIATAQTQPILPKHISGGVINGNETAVKTRLIRMKDLLIVAPADIPREVLEPLKEVTKFADTPDLNSEAAKLRFIESISETFDVISPNLLKRSSK